MRRSKNDEAIEALEREAGWCGPKAVRRSKPLYVLHWTPGHHRQVKTKKAGAHALKAWKRWYERKGWSVWGSATDGHYIATPRNAEGPFSLENDPRHAICFRVYARAETV